MGFPIKLECADDRSSLPHGSNGIPRGDGADQTREGAVGPALRAEGVGVTADRPGRSEPEIGILAREPLGFGRWSRWIAVAGGLGYVPVAPGTAGSIGGALLFVLVVYGAPEASASSAGLPLWSYATGVGLLLLLGIRAAGRAEIDFGRRDDGRIVIDEVVGQLIALSPLLLLGPFGHGVSGAAVIGGGDSFLFFFEVVTGFVLFRLFDVWKPGAIRWAERRFEGGWGVMADDVVAGVYAALCLLALHALVFERFHAPVGIPEIVGSVMLGSSGIGSGVLS